MSTTLYAASDISQTPFHAQEMELLQAHKQVTGDTNMPEGADTATSRTQRSSDWADAMQREEQKKLLELRVPASVTYNMMTLR